MFLYSDYEVTFSCPLTGDIAGSEYTLSLWLASGGTTTVDVALLVNQDGQEVTLAAAPFRVTSTRAELFTETISGIDPQTGPGDTLILRIMNTEGSDGAVFFADSQFETSTVVIPGIANR